MQIDKQNARLPGCGSRGGATPDDDQMKMKNENEKPKVESWNRKKNQKIFRVKNVQNISKVWKSPKSTEAESILW